MKQFVSSFLCLLTVTYSYGQLITVDCATSETFYDSGGPGGNYSEVEHMVVTYCPSDPGKYVSANFTSFELYSSQDVLTVIDGDQQGDLIWSSWIEYAPFSNPNQLPPNFTSSSSNGCLTFVFMSNNEFTVDPGWAATITCSSSPGSNTPICSPAECQGLCGTTLCASGNYTWTGNDNLVAQELNVANKDCMNTFENCGNWFYITPLSVPPGGGDITVNIVSNNGEDQDVLIWKGFNKIINCPIVSKDQPILCNYEYSDATGTGFNTANYNDGNLGYNPSLSVSEQDITDGAYFMLLVNTYADNRLSDNYDCPQTDITITLGGTATLTCDLLAATFGRIAGVARDDHNDIYWETISEQNCESFTLERSKDLTSWEQVGILPGAGNSDQTLIYTMKDYNRMNPITYYRVKERDFNGKLTYSEVISVTTHQDEDSWIVDIFPNPANENFTFQYNGTNQEDALEVAVYDLIGRQVIRQEFMLKKHQASVVNTQQLENGQYQVVFIQGRQKQTQNLIILKN